MINNPENNSEARKRNIPQNFTDLEERNTEAAPETCQEKAEHIVEEAIEVVAVCLGYNLFK